MTATDDIWITGVGTLSSLGSNYGELADALLAGRSGVAPVRGFDVANHPSRIAGQLGEVPCPAGDDPVAFARLERLERLARWCCVGALRDAGFGDRRGPRRVGLVLGLGAEWLARWETDTLAGGDAASDPKHDPPPLTERLRPYLDVTGPVASVSAACASGNHALAQARSWLRRGWIDVCLAGACDVGVSTMALAGFGNLRALSGRNDRPHAASRPFDRGRDGFVMAEGGAVFVLEPSSAARQRGARAYGAIAGFGATSDAHHMIIPSPDPSHAVAAMKRALTDAGATPNDLDYVNAHATGTTVGDIAESRALAAALGDAVRSVPVSATKSMTGHLLTAAAAVEVLACLAAIDRGALPPTINLDDPDPECDLLHVRHEAREARVRTVLSNSFGFGGSNTALVLRKV